MTTRAKLMAAPHDGAREPLFSFPAGPIMQGWMFRQWPRASVNFVGGQGEITSSTPLEARGAIWDYLADRGVEHLVREIGCDRRT
jgi:hypothetical protein